MDEAELAYQLKQVDIHASIKLLVKTWYDDKDNRLPDAEERMIDTTVGRVIFNRILPEEIQFVNWVLDKGGLKDLMADLYEVCGEEQTPDVADAIKDIGFTVRHPLRLFAGGFRHHRARGEEGDHRQGADRAGDACNAISAAAC